MSGRDIYARQTFGTRLGYGIRPALLLVDFVVGFNDANVLGGGNIAAAIDRSVGLLAAARELGIPVVFSRIVYEPGGVNAGAFAAKVPALLRLLEESPLSQVVPELAPRPEELVVRKTQASCFFETGLASWLRWRDVDTLLVAGCTTSGCVRASAVDATSHNFRTIVVRDCVGDRDETQHEANLFDLEQKYADVVSASEALAYLGGLPAIDRGSATRRAN